MKKSDLKTGMRVRFRNGNVYLVIKDVESDYGHQDIAFVSYDYGFMNGSSYDENLTDKNNTSVSSNYDIVEVYSIQGDVELSNSFLNLSIKNLIWKRQEYTEEQKELFKALKLLGFNYMAKDSDSELYAYTEKPHKTSENTWVDNEWDYIELNRLDKNLFNFINWEDREPFEIPA